MNLGPWWDVLRGAALSFWNHAALRYSASLAYYTVVSLAPLVIFVVALAGLVFGEDAARDQIVGQVHGLVGKEGADVVEAVIKGARDQQSGLMATAFGMVAFLVGLGGVFLELQIALNALWEVEPRPGRDLGQLVRTRSRSFALVLGVGFLLLVSLILSAGISAAGDYLNRIQPGLAWLWGIVQVVAAYGIITMLFAMIFKYLPDAEIAWHDVGVGALLTAALFTVGKGLIGLYLGNSGIASSYGAAGSVVVLLVWLYYSAAIMLFGAEVTRAYADRFGSDIIPSEQAVWATDRQLSAAAEAAACEKAE